MSNDTLTVPLIPFSLASYKRYFNPFLKDIGSVVKSLRQHAFDLEELQSIFSTRKARVGASNVLGANTDQVAKDKQMYSDTTSSCKCPGRTIDVPSYR